MSQSPKFNTKILGLVGGLVAVGAVAAFGSLAGGKSDSGDAHASVQLRLAHFPNVTHGPALIGSARGDFANALKGVANVDIKVVNAGPEAMEALLAGELDMTYVGPSPAINTYIKSNGDALKVVSGVCSGGASLIAAKDSGIQSIKDLAGKKVATPQLGNTQDVSLRHFMGKEGLRSKDKGGNVDVIPTKNPDILTLFKQGQIDAAWVPEPWASRICQETGAKRVIDERTLWPDGQFTTTVIVASRQFAEKHPEVVEAVVRANSDIVDWSNGNAEEAKKLVNEQLGKLVGKPLPQAILDESWSYLEFTTDPGADSFRVFIDAAKDLGYLKSKPENVDAMFELSSLEKVKKS